MTDALRKCPFCCATPVILETNELYPDKYQRCVTVRCDLCGVEVTDAQTTLVEQRNALYQAIFDYQTSLARLRQATGH